MNELTKREVAKIFNLPTLYVRGMFDRPDFPKKVVTSGKSRRIVVDAFDLVMYLNYTGILRGKTCNKRKE